MAEYRSDLGSIRAIMVRHVRTAAVTASFVGLRACVSPHTHHKRTLLTLPPTTLFLAPSRRAISPSRPTSTKDAQLSDAVAAASNMLGDLNLVGAIVVVLSFTLIAHIAAGDGPSSMVVARRLAKLREQVRSQPVDGSEYHDLETARREVARLRQQLMGLGDCSAQYFALRWSPWGTILVIIHGFMNAILDLLETLGGNLMFRLLVNFGLRAFCARANLPYNMYEIVARQGMAAFNRERSFSWRVSPRVVGEYTDVEAEAPAPEPNRSHRSTPPFAGACRLRHHHSPHSHTPAPAPAHR